MGKSYKRNDDLMIDSSSIAIDSDGTSLQDGIKYKIYNSVTDLGLFSGSATISDAWTALRAIAPAVLVCNAGQFNYSTQMPGANQYGVVEIVVAYSSSTTARGFINFHAFGDVLGDYRMFLLNGSIPSGTWVKVTNSKDFKIENVTVFSSTSIAANSYTSLTASITKTGYTPISICGVNVSGGAGSNASACVVGSFYFTDSNTKVYCRVRNTGSSQATVTCVASILYVKS